MLAILAALVPGGAVAASADGNGVSSAQTRAPQAVRDSDTWAVVVGIDDYRDREALESATSDAEVLEDALDKAGVPPRQRRLLRDEAATANAIRHALNWLVRNARPGDTAVLFFAGHAERIAAGTEAIVAADGAVLTDAELGERLSDLRATRAWISIAACFGGGFTELLGPERILTAASNANSLAYENDDLEHSYFVEYMIKREMLGGRIESVQDAFARAADSIRHDHPNRVPVMVNQATTDVFL